MDFGALYFLHDWNQSGYLCSSCICQPLFWIELERNSTPKILWLMIFLPCTINQWCILHMNCWHQYNLESTNPWLQQFQYSQVEYHEYHNTVYFLYLTITIKNDCITSRTFPKSTNPHLYIPPHYAHAQGMVNWIIFSLLWTYYKQNSKYSDFVYYVDLLFKHLLLQGWENSVFKNIALTKLIKTNQAPNPTATGPATSLHYQQHLFYHKRNTVWMTFHIT